MEVSEAKGEGHKPQSRQMHFSELTVNDGRKELPFASFHCHDLGYLAWRSEMFTDIQRREREKRRTCIITADGQLTDWDPVLQFLP